VTDERDNKTVADRARRGVAVITFAKAWFLLTGFAQPVLLTRALGREGYGVYGAVLSAVSILNNVVVAGSIQAMSRSVSAHGTSAIRRGLALHVGLGALLSLGFALAAEPMGRAILRDPGLPPLLRLASIVTGMYCVYAALVGALNGTQRFVAQAGLDMLFATLRTGLIVGLAFAGLGVSGAISGFAAASIAITIVAALGVLRATPTPAPAVEIEQGTDREAPAEGGAGSVPRHGSERSGVEFVVSYAGFFAPVLIYQLALNLVLQADVLILQAILARAPGATLTAVQGLVGVYKGVQNFAFLPYQLLVAVTFVLFPVVSKAAEQGDVETTRTMLRGALRFAFVLLGGMLAVIAGAPHAVLRLVYRPEFGVGAEALRWLTLGQGSFALAVIALTVILASRRVFTATALIATMLALVLAGDVVALYWAGFGPNALRAVALGTSAGTTLGLLLIGRYLLRLYGPVVPWASAARSAIAGVIAGAIGAVVHPESKLGALALCAAVGAAFVLLLLGSGEVSAEERSALRSRIGRRRDTAR
jgi:stage V sporulation protein B